MSPLTMETRKSPGRKRKRNIWEVFTAMTVEMGQQAVHITYKQSWPTYL